MGEIFNTKLAGHPLNWLIVFLMLIIAAIAGHEILSLAKIEPTVEST